MNTAMLSHGMSSYHKSDPASHMIRNLVLTSISNWKGAGANIRSLDNMRHQSVIQHPKVVGADM